MFEQTSKDQLERADKKPNDGGQAKMKAAIEARIQAELSDFDKAVDALKAATKLFIRARGKKSAYVALEAAAKAVSAAAAAEYV